MSILLKGDGVKTKYDFTDPYSRSLARFFARVAGNAEQIQLVKEWAVYEELRPYIDVERDEEDNIVKFKVIEKTKDEYLEVKQRLKERQGVPLLHFT